MLTANRWTSWTKPYYGVQHRCLKTDAGTIFQATVNAYESIAIAKMLSLKSEHPFTPIMEKTCKDAAEARAWLDQQIRKMERNR